MGQEKLVSTRAPDKQKFIQDSSQEAEKRGARGGR
jgi:hypothetical protein